MRKCFGGFIVFTLIVFSLGLPKDSFPADDSPQSAIRFRCPLESGKVITNYGKRYHNVLKMFRFHYGMDIQAKKGAPISAIADGTVELAGINGGYGKNVRIRHANGYSSFYGHLDQILVQEGQKVKVGTLIGRVGSSGLTTIPHLHLEIRHQGEALNSLGFINCVQTLSARH